MGRRLSLCLDVTSTSSHSLKARKLRFGTQTPHQNATKVAKGIFEILFEATLLYLFKNILKCTLV